MFKSIKILFVSSGADVAGRLSQLSPLVSLASQLLALRGVEARPWWAPRTWPLPPRRLGTPLELPGVALKSSMKLHILERT